MLARWLRTEPKVLLLDEPTQGVDVGAKAALYRKIRDSAAEGVAVLVASSDAEELVNLCDRVLVFRSGGVAIELRANTLTVERLIAETLGATSHRKNMRVGREPIKVKVIRDTDDEVSEPTQGEQPVVVAATENHVAGGRFARMARAAIARWKARG